MLLQNYFWLKSYFCRASHSEYFWRLYFLVITFQLVTATMPKRNRNYSPSDMDQALEAIKSEYVDKKSKF